MSEPLSPLSDFEPLGRTNLPENLPASSVRAVVFVHGIRSDHSTFEPLVKRLRELKIGAEFNRWSRASRSAPIKGSPGDFVSSKASPLPRLAALENATTPQSA